MTVEVPLGEHSRQFVENTMRYVQEVATLPGMRQRLPELGHLQAIAANRWFMPELHDGKLYVPPEYRDSDHIPVFALKPGDQVELSDDFASITPIQRKEAIRKLLELEPDEDEEVAEARLKTILQLGKGQTKPVTGDLAGEIRYRYMTTPVPAGGTFPVVHSRPLLVLGQEQEGQEHATLPVVAHEVIHVQQAHTKPLTTREQHRRENAIKRELAAIHVGGVTAHAMLLEGLELSKLDEFQHRIEILRSQTNTADDPFRLNPQLAEIMRDYPVTVL